MREGEGYGRTEIIDSKDLNGYFYTSGGVSKAVDGVSFEVEKGRNPGHCGRVRFRQERYVQLHHPSPAGQDRKNRGRVH